MDNQQAIEYENALRESELRGAEEKVQNYQKESMLLQQDKSMIQEQLDLGEELERIDYLLRGYTLEKDKDTGEMKWTAPTNNDNVVLSDYGVHLIRNTIAWYLNKNTLLSNYDEETIRHKMEDFATDLTDTIFMEYEKVFQYPTFEECKEVFNNRIEGKKKLKIFAMELLGKKVTEDTAKQIEEDLLKRMEPIIEQELEKIKTQIIKNKLKRFLIIIREIQDAVHSTYNRAFGGQERKTLREHIHISETKGGNTIQPQRSGIMDMFRRK